MDRTNDHLERLISRHLDGRLSEAEARDLARQLESSPAARALDQAFWRTRALLRSERPPQVPAGLLERTLARVAAERARRVARAPVVRLARWLAAAAAVLLCAALVGGEANRGVHAGRQDAPQMRTIEDEIRDRARDDGSLKDFLSWRFLRRER